MRAAISTYDDVTPQQLASDPNITMKVTENGEKWSCPTVELLLLGYSRGSDASYFRTSYFEGYNDSILSFTALARTAHVRIEAPDRSQVAAVVNVFESGLTSMRVRTSNAPAGIEYAGVPGVTAECRDAIMRLLQFGDEITHARILSNSGTHGLLLTVNVGDRIAIKSGLDRVTRGKARMGFRSFSNCSKRLARPFRSVMLVRT